MLWHNYRKNPCVHRMLSYFKQRTSTIAALLLASVIGIGALPDTAESEVRPDAAKFAECVSTNSGRLFGVDIQWLKDDSVHIKPISQPRFILLAGRLGWHTTWTVLLDLESKPVAAFETYDEHLRTGSSGFARRNVPYMIKRALELCDVSWVGTPSQHLIDEFISNL